MGGEGESRERKGCVFLNLIYLEIIDGFMDFLILLVLIVCILSLVV